MAKKYIVDLNKDEKAELVSLTQKGRPGARKIKRANILLLANAGKPDFEVAELLHTSWLTVLRTRHRFVEGGLDFALYEAFSPQQARYLTKKLEPHYTPEHSSWLNMAEVEISVLTEQCLDRRLGSQAIVASEVGAWEAERNAARATIDWRFTIPNARDKLKKLYPVREEQN
jgi:hypothetical protein